MFLFFSNEIKLMNWVKCLLRLSATCLNRKRIAQRYKSFKSL